MEAIFNESESGKIFRFLTDAGTTVRAKLFWDFPTAALLSDSNIFSGGSCRTAHDNGYLYGWTGAIYSGLAKFDLPVNIIKVLSFESEKEKKERNKYTFLRKDVETERIYSGRYQYHEIKQYNKLLKPTDLKTGIELEMISKPDQYTNLRKIKSNWFWFQYDGSLGNSGWELTTVPLPSNTAKNPKTYETLCQELAKYATSYENRETGLHVHLSREHFYTRKDPATERANLVKALFLYAYVLQNANNKIFLRSYNDYSTRIEIRQARALYEIGTKYIKNNYLMDLQNNIYTSIPRTRYSAINITNPYTVEFRQGKGTIKAESIARMVEYCQLVTKYASTRPFSAMDLDKFKTYASKHASDSVNSILYSI